jgi:hypothetical protein
MDALPEISRVWGLGGLFPAFCASIQCFAKIAAKNFNIEQVFILRSSLPYEVLCSSVDNFGLFFFLTTTFDSNYYSNSRNKKAQQGIRSKN